MEKFCVEKKLKIFKVLKNQQIPVILLKGDLQILVLTTMICNI